MHFFALPAILTLVCVSASGHWKYPDWDNGEKFPDWGGICESGRRQSPINLSHKGALKGYYDKLIFKNYDEEQPTAIMVNNGHTIQLSGFPDNMEVTGGPLRGTYVVEQLHFHWWSEHTIEHVRFPLEVHIVHRNKHYTNISEALHQHDGIAVIGVLFHASNSENEAIAALLKSLDQVKTFDQLNQPIELNTNFAVDDLFPHITGYMTYPGSLTTPSCAESVTWIVLTETFPVQIDQVNTFKQIEFEEGRLLTSNYRDIQKNNHRELIVVLQDGQLEQSSGAASRYGSLGGALFAFLLFTPHLK